MLTQMIEKVSLSNPLGMSELSVVEVEVDSIVDDVVHRARHRHLSLSSLNDNKVHECTC